MSTTGWTCNQTDYCCGDCGYDPSDGEDDDELWGVLNDIATVPAAAESRPLAEDALLQLWQDRTAA